MGAVVSRPKLPIFDTFLPGMVDYMSELGEQARQRCVYVETKEEFGTGFIAETGLVICNKHYLKGARNILVDGQPARIICRSQYNDLAALHTPTGRFPPIKIVDKVTVGEKVFYFGNTQELKQTRYEGKITHVDRKRRLGASCCTEDGTCGASLWNSVGVIGVLCTYEGQVTALALHGAVLRRFISFAKRKFAESNSPDKMSEPAQLNLM